MSGPTPSILVVDDEADVAQGMARIFAAAQCRVTSCTSGKAAIAAMKRERFAILVTDMFMPDVDGCEIIAFARRHAPEMKIVAVSGGGVYSKGAEALTIADSLGADATLIKPFSPAQLVAAAIQ